MTLLQQISAARKQRQQAMPWGDTCDLLIPTDGTSSGEDQWGNPVESTPGGFVPSGVPLACLASRLSAEDATKAGLASERELWRVVTNVPNAVPTSGHVRVTKADGRVLTLAVQKIEGTDMTVIVGEVQ